jgi:hypothetical protein
MSHEQPSEDPYQTRPFTPFEQGQSYGPPQGQYPGYQQQPYNGQGAVQPAPQYQPAPPGQDAHPPQAVGSGRHSQRHAAGKHYGLNGAEMFWYILGCISFGAAYFSKIPGKKAACEVFSELQLDGQGPGRAYSLNGMESFWYILMCLWFGSGYFAKVSAKKALWELAGMVQSAPDESASAIGRALSGASVSPYGPGY